jgi:hypothetical protein
MGMGPTSVSLSVASPSPNLTLERTDRWRGLREYAPLRWLLPLALLHGLLYLVIVPPWQHYDEPTHFEYAWLIVVHNHIPTMDESDPQMRHNALESMDRFRFYPPGQHLDLTDPNPSEIGMNQRYHPALYYMLVALPLRLVADLPIDVQLYTARTLSLILYALIIATAWRVTVVVVPDEPLIQLVVPLMLLFTASFADMMTAVNNDVLVNFAAAALLLGCVLLVCGGMHPTSLVLATLALGVGLITKRTAVILLVPYLLALLWAWHRTPLRLWMVAGVLVIGTLMSAFAGLEIVQAANGTRILALRPWLNQLDSSYLRLSLDSWVRSVSDLEQTNLLYQLLLTISFTSFWVRFGWGNIVIGSWADWVMVGICVACAVGLIVQGWRSRSQMSLSQQRCIWLFLIAVVLGCLSLIARLHPLPSPGYIPYIPRGRYIFTIMLPVIWLIVLGWQGLFPNRWKHVSPIIILGIWGAIDLIVWSNTLIAYFYGVG